VQDIFRTVTAINAARPWSSTTHAMLATASRGYVLQTGSIIAGGDRAALRNDDGVRHPHLGRSAAERVRL
jgi:ABC-type branched-subunit amino acid transport system ATPase component